jgi:PIN domain nuclease of toxin-antitoxin system
MNSVVLDASAVITALNQEPGAEKLTPDLLRNAVSSTVNLAEVQSKLVDRGLPPDDAWKATLNSVREAVPFTAEHAKTAGSLIAQTRPLGLSLGDRACLALALSLNAPIYTADRSWKNLRLGVRIHVIR